MPKSVARALLIAGFFLSAAVARADGQGSYVPCDDGLRCLMAPCPSNSTLDLASGKIIRGVSVDIDGLPQQDKALDLSDKLYAGKVVVAGTIENLLSKSPPQGPRPEIREGVRGYVAGYNKFLSDTGVNNLSDPNCRGKPWVRPMTTADLSRATEPFARSASSSCSGRTCAIHVAERELFPSVTSSKNTNGLCFAAYRPRLVIGQSVPSMPSW